MVDITKILETVPIPTFVALHSGVIVYGNSALAAASGQPDLAGLDRTLFGLGIFHNAAEFRGFLQSFRYGGNTRRLALPTGRFKTTSRPLILYGTLIEWEGEAALCGMMTRHHDHQDSRQEGNSSVLGTDVFDQIDRFAMVVSLQGKVLYMNKALGSYLGLDLNAPLPEYRNVDVEQDIRQLRRMLTGFRDSEELRYESNFQRQDGTLVPVEAVLKPVSMETDNARFIITAEDITDRRRLQGQVENLKLEVKNLREERISTAGKRKANGNGDRHAIITSSGAYVRILEQIDQVARTDSTVLITGETGTGKELIARAIHRGSARADQPLVILNCGALPADLIESELFGYRKGAFTGADKDYQGRFELADKGTLFLDEIGEMPMLLQTRLLRFLQEGEFMPLGARSSITSDVRVVAATNRDLKERVGSGDFRADLFYRLNVFPIHSLPLRERKEDIPVLIDHFIGKYNPSGTEAPKLRPRDLTRLLDNPFPGNVRELENVIQRGIITAKDNYLNIELEEDVDGRLTKGSQISANNEDGELLTFEQVQRRHIIDTLERTSGKVSGPGGAAELLELKTQTLFSKMRKLGIQRK